MDRRALHLSSAGFFVASIVVGFGILTVGFRILYDSVIPEVAALVMSGFFMAIMRPRQSWLSMLGLGIGTALSALFPVPAPADHVARYGPPAPFSFLDLLRIWAFPVAGTVLGLLSRLTARAIRRVL